VCKISDRIDHKIIRKVLEIISDLFHTKDVLPEPIFWNKLALAVIQIPTPFLHLVKPHLFICLRFDFLPESGKPLENLIEILTQKSLPRVKPNP
jgi:hypothetical protein